MGCVFARELWWLLLSRIGLESLVPVSDDDLGTWWLRQRGWIDQSGRKAFDSLLLLIAWTLWKERNNRTFGRAAADITSVAQGLVHEVSEWVAAGFVSFPGLSELWSQNQSPM